MSGYGERRYFSVVSTLELVIRTGNKQDNYEVLIYETISDWVGIMEIRKGVSYELNVNIAGCLEKNEIKRRKKSAVKRLSTSE